MLTSSHLSQIEFASSNFNNNTEIEIRIKFPKEYFENLNLSNYVDSITMINDTMRRESFYKGVKKDGQSVDLEKKYLVRIKLNEIVTIAIANEEPITFNTQGIKLVRFKRRYTVHEKLWTIHYTQSLTLQGSGIHSVANTLQMLFSDKMKFKDWDLEVELKDYRDIQLCIETILRTHPNSFERYYFTPSIMNLYKLMHRKFPKEFSLKRLVNNPVMLGRPQWNTIDEKNYSVIDKSDGQRCILYIDNEMVYEYIEKSVTYILRIKSKMFGRTIIDCEKIGSTYYTFDIMLCDDILVTNENYTNRLERLCSIVKSISEKNIVMKTINVISDGSVISSTYYTRQKYDIDGLIFTPTDGNYWDLVYKWKPAELMTFDLVIVPNVKNYILMCGIKRDLISKVSEFPTNYKELSKQFNAKSNYLAVPFSPAINPNIYIFNTDEEFDKPVVGEFSFQGGQFHLLRMRDDKSALISQGVYGNDFIVLEKLLIELQNPLTIDDMVSGTRTIVGGEYFVKQKTIEIRAPIKFNTFVKFTLLSALAKSKYVIDIASGKGQDLFVYHGLEVQNLTLVEPDTKAVVELDIRTKQLGNPKFYVNTPVSKNRMKIDIINKNFAEFLQLERSVAGADIVCNFAIHYILREKKDYITFTDFCKGANSVTLTYFDSEIVRKQLPFNQDRYHIEQLTGDRILVKHHFADELYEESLVNTELLIVMMERKGFRLIRRDSFGKYLNTFKTLNESLYNMLSEADKTYCSFYQYVVFKKI